MREIGVRELKASLSQLLRDVDAGEHVRVTSHGRPIADIVPAGSGRAEERFRALVAKGRVTPAARSSPNSPARPLATGRSATEIVLAEREAER